MIGEVHRCDGCDQDQPIAWVEGMDLPDGTTEILTAYCRPCYDQRAEAERALSDAMLCNDCGQSVNSHDGTLCIEIQAEELAKIRAEERAISAEEATIGDVMDYHEAQELATEAELESPWLEAWEEAHPRGSE